MMPGSWATYRGQLVQVLRIEGGKSRNWGGSRRTPKVWTLVPYGNPEGTYTVVDPSSADLRPAQPPEGYQAPPVAPEPTQAPVYTSGEPW